MLAKVWHHIEENEAAQIWNERCLELHSKSHGTRPDQVTPSYLQNATTAVHRLPSYDM